ncbi:MAG: hypothetical protein ACRDQ0_09835 [Pseudonocardia sp.]
MPDAHYVDPRLVRVYDPISAGRPDLGFYLQLAGPEPLSVLDLGCGTGELTRRERRVEGLGDVRWHVAVTGVTGERVSFESHYDFSATGEQLTSVSTLRFLDEPALRAHLHAAGFRDVTIHGDWDGSEVSETSPELIVRAWGRR